MKQLNPLIPFDLIVDTDSGLINLLKRDYLRATMFKPGMLLVDDNMKKYQLLHRPSINPLYNFTWQKDIDDIDDLYKDFMDKKYDEILKLSPYTTLYAALRLFVNSKGAIIPTVLCKCQAEIDYIASDDSINNSRVLLAKKGYDHLDISDYDPIYLKDFMDYTKCKNPFAKNIYISNYDFNIETLDDGLVIPRKDLGILFLDQNRATVVDVYNIPSGVGIIKQ